MLTVLCVSHSIMFTVLTKTINQIVPHKSFFFCYDKLKRAHYTYFCFVLSFNLYSVLIRISPSQWNSLRLMDLNLRYFYTRGNNCSTKGPENFTCVTFLDSQPCWWCQVDSPPHVGLDCATYHTGMGYLVDVISCLYQLRWLYFIL